MLALVLEKLPAQAFAVKVSGEDKQNKTKQKKQHSQTTQTLKNDWTKRPIKSVRW